MKTKQTVDFEDIRRLTRRLIGYNSRLYRTASFLLDFIAIITKEDFPTWVTFRRLRDESSEQVSPVPIKLRNLRYPIHVRPHTEDVAIVVSNIIREEYGQFQFPKEPKWMIDAGAYIGDTTAYFLSRFPQLMAVSLEPNPPSYEMASLNLGPYAERSVLLKKGLSSNQERVRFGGNSTGASIQDGGFEIECTSIQALIEQFAIERINILKMDIEGAEELIFQSNPESWLHCVDVLIIEIHGAQLEELIGRRLQQSGFYMRRFRSVWYFSRDY